MKTRYIKYLALPLMVASAWSCTDLTEDVVNEATGGSTIKEIVLQLPELKTADTRTEFTVDEVNKTLKTAWAEGDVAGIFPTTGYNQVEFPISDAWGESVARFDGGDWALRANKSYAAYFPFNKANFERDASSIILSYEGQKQIENGSVSHLSNYDYLATGAVQADSYGSIYFQMQRLSGIVRFDLLLPQDEESPFIKLFLSANEEVFDVEKVLNITEENPELSTAKSSRSISMDLDNIYADENHQLVVFMTLPPMEVDNVQLMLMKEDGTMFVTHIDGFRVEAAHVQGYTVYDFEETIVNTAIEFEDDAVKAICVDNWDINGDGELGIAEAALVSSLNRKFREIGDISSFNELIYFTGLTEIGDYDFEACGLQSITIPENVERIGHRAFGYNILTSVISNNSRYEIYDDCMVIDVVDNKVVFNFNDQTIKEVVIPNFVTTIGETAFGYQEGVTSVTIPNSVTTIEGWAFDDCRSLESITIPSSVTSIGRAAFALCFALKNVSVPSSVTSIGSLAFSSLYNVETFSIDNSRYSLLDNNLLIEDGFRVISCLGTKSSQTIPSTITEMVEAFYWSCPNILIMESTTPPNYIDYGLNPWMAIPDGGFAIYVPAESLETYRNAAWWSNFSQYIRVPENINFEDDAVKAICVANWDTNGDGELNYAEAASVTGFLNEFQNSDIVSFNELQYFIGLEGVSDFDGCASLQSITLPEGISYIGDYAFSCCSSLTSITIPKSVKRIEYEAFDRCFGMTSITLLSETPASLGDAVFDETNNCPIYVPSSAVDAYKEAWPEYADRIVGGSIEGDGDVHVQDPGGWN